MGEQGRFESVDRLWKRSGVKVAAMKRLAQADAYGSMGLDRQAALWSLRGLSDEPLPLLDEIQESEGEREPARLPRIARIRKVMQDYRSTGLSLKAHPVSFIRDRLTDMGVTACAELSEAARTPAGERLAVAGIVLVRQRPGAASGIVFITLEDETGIANLIVRPKVYERYRRAARHSTILIAEGKVERQGVVVHVLVSRLASCDGDLAELTSKSRDFH